MAMRPRYTSNAGIFEKRGDPWVSRREGERDYNRNLEIEDPEYDFDHRFHEAGNVIGKPVVAPRRQEHHDPKPVRREEDEFARRKANIARRMNSNIAAKTRGVTAVSEAVRVFRPCPGCRSARCIARRLCQNNK
jgi:hypothetical protein